jgi:LuxR family transcriptional regulator, maltose regulon positive regulatory protein
MRDTGRTMTAKGAVESASIEPLIEAKLARPRPRAGVIPRRRLFAALDRLKDTELTVISGPAGSGKTVLVSSWLAVRTDLATAWATLDTGDDDPYRFWKYVAHAVDRVRPGMARPALATLRMPRTSVELAIADLLNGLAGYDGRIVIVLDDLHHVSAESCLRSLAYAVERLPPPARMIVTTRSDPGRRLSRLRARGALGELRAKDTAFTNEEAHELLVKRAGIPVTTEDIETLVDRTEGWPAGVSLAALWLAGIDEPSNGIRQFSGTHRHVADYLASEVLETVDHETRDFLLKTSIFDRFSAPPCDAILGTETARRMLADLERSNLFLIALDGRGDWYRYHHLFRELLRIELADTSSDVVPELHRRAAEWFRANGFIEQALVHAAAVSHDELAKLLTGEHLNLIRAGKVDVLMDSLDLLSDDELAEHPVVAAAGAVVAGTMGHPTAKRKRLEAIAEANRGDLPDAEQRYVEFVVSLTRASVLDHDLESTLGHAVRAVDLGRSHVPGLVVIALAVSAYATYLRGDATAARATAEEAIAQPDADRQLHGFVYARALLALLEYEAGRPHEAEVEARDTVVSARELGLAGTWTAGLAHHALGQALLQLGRVQEAERELDRAEVLRRGPEPRLDHAHSLLVLAQARIARGRLTLAASELEAAREHLDAIGGLTRLAGLAADVERQLEEARAGSPKPVEPPSLAELAVLRLLATDLSQREIGNELFLSMNTVKTHTRKLYGKLGVSTREEAVRRANTLGLIGIADSPG